MKRQFDVAFTAKTLLICLLFGVMLAVQSVAAREIAGVAVPESVSLENKVLVLNGAGIRKKLFMKI